MDDLFFRLTPDWVLHAVEAGGFEPSGHSLALNSLENRVYDLRLEDGSHVVAKFYRPGRWSKEAILEEHQFLAELREAEIPVCAPIQFADGRTLHEVEGIYYAVWPRTGGRAPDELDEDNAEILGRLVARIHNVGAAGSAPHRRRLDTARFVGESLETLKQGFLPRDWSSRYERAALALGAIYDQRSRGIPVHRIHGDCHLGNLLRGREGYFFLDFDDFMLGPAVQDVWMLIMGRDEEALHLRQVFLKGYRQFRPFEERWLRLIEPLRALRVIHYAAWIARRWNDPAFPGAFPQFNTEQYWERETIDLERQLGLINEG
ncbi:MAG: serine/threonine protein kinase [Deltaproteobacteria bacterium]|nr:serine/threonine protein kinase [Deltaproteobacteria bacterium]